MKKTLTFFYDYLSPYTYLAYTQLSKLLEGRDLQIDYVPVALSKLMPLVNNRPTTFECQPKRAYASVDLLRWARRYQIPFSFSPYYFKLKPIPLYLGAIAAKHMGEIETYNRVVFEAVWVNGSDLESVETFNGLLLDAGVENSMVLLETRHSGEIAEELEQNIARAEQVGVFGAPTFQLDDELFFGNDRLDFLFEALELESA